jgi:uncharacterized protein (TIGR00375 family)
MLFYADFHIHSHFSMATSRELSPEKLDYWAAIKGLKVIGSGDFTHPGWQAELKEKLEPAEDGLFRLKEAYRLNGGGGTRFMLTAEISNVYKKEGKARRVHNILFAPDFTTVEKIAAELSKIGNLASDGRPILKLDSRDLLEIVLEASPDGALVPAHIWTPWYSMLGNKSGFDNIKECFGDLSEHIFAVETGLSSDPPMNRRCDFLDNVTLISNSDAHSPEKLGREANIINCKLSYLAIMDAIKKGAAPEFLGTIEFFPQEGKYYFDGHRKCGISLSPQEARAYNFLCPVCGKRITSGVLHRVEQLASRSETYSHPQQPLFYSFISLKDILSAVLKSGINSKRISTAYSEIIKNGLSELDILLNLPQNDLNLLLNDQLTQAIMNIRKGKVKIAEGFDGKFGEITLF